MKTFKEFITESKIDILSYGKYDIEFYIQFTPNGDTYKEKWEVDSSNYIDKFRWLVNTKKAGIKAYNYLKKYKATKVSSVII